MVLWPSNSSLTVHKRLAISWFCATLLGSVSLHSLEKIIYIDLQFKINIHVHQMFTLKLTSKLDFY